MLTLFAVIAGIVLVLLLRPARARPVPARIVTGDIVCSDEDVIGIVERIDGAFALVRCGDRGVWVLANKLMITDRKPNELPTSEVSPNEPACLPSPVTHPALHDGRLARFGAGVHDARRVIVVGWILIALVCIPLSSTLERRLSAGGFTPAGETQDVVNDMRETYNLPVARLEVIVPGTPEQAQQRVSDSRALLQRIPMVATYDNFRSSTDGTHAAFTVMFNIQDEYVVDSLPELRSALSTAGFPAASTRLAGTPAHYEDIGVQTKQDLVKAERIGIPLALLVLLVVFGTLTAAAMPLIIGLVTLIVTLAILHVLTLPMHLSIYVMNIASLLGLGLGIDYSLLGVARFREELARGIDVRTATATTVAIAGRAAAISGAAVLLGMTALAVIDLKVMTSMAIAGIVVVLVSVAATLTLLPALLAMVGPRIERWAVRRPRSSNDRWYRWVHGVMRRPGRAAFGAIALLVLVAAPARHVELGVPHNEVLPKDTPARSAARMLSQSFNEDVIAPIVVDVASNRSRITTDAQAQLEKIPGVERVRMVELAATTGHTLLLVTPAEGKLGGEASRALTRAIRNDLNIPASFRLSGQGPGEIEFLNTIAHGMPRVLLLVFASTFIVLLLAFRSVALPAKAILLDTLSIIGSLGAVVAVFQFGMGSHVLGADALGYTEATIPIVLFCILFGLSMDYEVFMLARITELYQHGHDNDEATARGVAGTAPLITGAALILIVLGLSFATSQIILVKTIGFGLAIALALDATLVRFVLLPAAMRMMGPANWWLPNSLLRRIPRMSWAH